MPPGGPIYGAAGPPKSDASAIAALVCGIVGLACFLPAIAAIVLGFSSKSRIDQSNGQLTGRGMAIAGIVLGIIALVGSAVLIPIRIANN